MVTTSPSLSNLAMALVQFKAECPKIKFNRTVKYQTRSGEMSYQYADLPNLEQVTTPVLAKHGLAVIQAMGSPGEVTTLLVHSSGEFIQSVASMAVPKDQDKKELGGITTYLRRYGLQSILGIAADADNEGGGGAASQRRGSSSTSTKAQPQQNPAPAAAGLLILTQEVKEQMVKAINKGMHDDVAERLPKYQLTQAQRIELTTMIDSAKAKAQGAKQKSDSISNSKS
jgi:hypothetical protein